MFWQCLPAYWIYISNPKFVPLFATRQVIEKLPRFVRRYFIINQPFGEYGFVAILISQLVSIAYYYLLPPIPAKTQI